MSSSGDENDYRNLAVKGLRPRELQWALNHDAVHGIGYAFKNPVAVAEASDDPNDDRRPISSGSDAITWPMRWEKSTKRSSSPGKAGMHAFGFVRALSREGLERVADDEERR